MSDFIQKYAVVDRILLVNLLARGDDDVFVY